MSASRRSSKLHDRFERLRSEAGGVVELQVVLLTDLPGLSASRHAGDPEAIALLAMAEESVELILSAPLGSPVRCGACQVPIGNGNFALVSAQAARHDPDAGVGLAICADCATTREAVLDKAIDSLRSLWPDLRRIEVSDALGHA